MGDVHTFKVIPAATEPDAELIATIEGLLEDAKSGALQALAYCTVRMDGEIGTGWDGAGGTRYALGMAVSILSVRYPADVAGLA